jgi:hypothetical protein
MKTDDEQNGVLPEYDFEQMTGGVRGKYAVDYRQSTNLVRLEPIIATAIAADEEVSSDEDCG